ncbi:MAG TPA: hypothetical protein PKY96_09245 [Flavobacteriales bacterium]|nr:hypothetical protein [Flavobacteriales bacterium]
MPTFKLPCAALLVFSFATSPACAQERWEWEYAFEHDCPMLGHPAAPDGHGGYRVFRFHAFIGEPVEGLVASFHLAADGSVLSADKFRAPLLDLPVDAMFVHDTLSALASFRFGSDRLMITSMDAAGAVSSHLACSVPGAEVHGWAGRAVYYDGHFYLMLSYADGSGSDFDNLLTIFKLSTVGNLVAYRTNALPNELYAFRQMTGVPGMGLVLAGAEWSGTGRLAALALDTTLDLRWSFIGPEMPYDAVPIVRANSDGDCLFIWGDPQLERDGLLLTDSTGAPIRYARSGCSVVGDAQLLPDGGFLVVDEYGPTRSRVQRYSSDWVRLWSGTVDGVVKGTLVQDADPSRWRFFSGGTTAYLAVTLFDVDGTCSDLQLDGTALTLIPTATDPLPLLPWERDVLVSSEECVMSDFPWTSSVVCTTVGYDLLDRPSPLRCEQLASGGTELIVDVHGPGAEFPQASLTDAMGRTLPMTTDWSMDGVGTQRLRLITSAAPGIGVLRLHYGATDLCCKLLFDRR